MTLQPPDTHHLSAAVGWLELGNASEAEAELKKISRRQQRNPDVLEVTWSIYGKQEKWEECVTVAKALTDVAPTDSFGWIHLSFALHELKKTQQAYNNLNTVMDRFPNEWLMRYNMACYACQLGNREEAQEWLDEAGKLKRDKKGIREMAKSDPDLAPLFTAGN